MAIRKALSLIKLDQSGAFRQRDYGPKPNFFNEITEQANTTNGTASAQTDRPGIKRVEPLGFWNLRPTRGRPIRVRPFIIA